MVAVAQRLLGSLDWVSSLVVLGVLMIVLSPIAAWLREDSTHHEEASRHNQT